MKIQYLNGGLANQIFQYIFVRYAQLSFPEQDIWYLDDSFFFINQVHNGYELEHIFRLKPNLLSQYFDSDIWNQLLEEKRNGGSIPQSFKNLGFDIIMITEFENYHEHNPFDGQIYRIPGNTFIPEILKANNEFVYYHGYWQHPDWFRNCQSILKKELSFPPILDEQNRFYANQILNSKSVAVHIRRGDYAQFGWASSADYYLQKIKEILLHHPDAAFYVFSDDIPWCRQNDNVLGLTLPQSVTYIEGNTQGKNFIDLQLMSMCRIMVINRSAFGYLAMLLNDRLDYFFFDESAR
ncbi:alpha-1,2-fucosyltransferase [Lachnospiraceae bacterium 64-25]